MTPFEIRVLLHYYAMPVDFPNLTHEQVVGLISAGVLKVCVTPAATTFGITERGEAYCEALTKVPLPVQKWVMPT